LGWCSDNIRYLKSQFLGHATADDLGSKLMDKQNIVFKFVAMSCFNQHNAVKFEYRFGCTRKGVHLYSVKSPGKLIFAVLEL